MQRITFCNVWNWESSDNFKVSSQKNICFYARLKKQKVYEALDRNALRIMISNKNNLWATTVEQALDDLHTN